MWTRYTFFEQTGPTEIACCEEMPMGLAVLEIDVGNPATPETTERVGVADVIFGEEGDSALLGAFTLEALGLSLDPLRRELRPLPMILALGRDA